MNILISCVVCTYNRAPYLFKALQSLDKQTLDSALCEIIVVDNGSTDNTRDVFKEYANKPNWHYIHEPVVGLSRARNTGWKSSQGIYVAYLDDDALAQPVWLAKIVDTFETFKPMPGCVGGRCLPIWEAPQPNWLLNNMLSAFSIFHYSDAPIVLDAKQLLTGCNIAFPREVLQSLGGFREDLGRQGSNLLCNEDKYIRDQLDRLELISIYHPEIVVEHHIPASRLTKKWFRHRAYWQGISLARMLHAENNLSVNAATRLILDKTAWGLLRLGLMLFTISEAKRFRRLLQVLQTSGFISEVWRLAATKARQ